MALRSVDPCDASAAAVKGGLRAVASSWLEAASELEDVEKAAAATFRELDATAGPEPSCLNAERETDLDANAMTIVLVQRGVLRVCGGGGGGGGGGQTRRGSLQGLQPSRLWPK
jgi:hypothetical protein